MRIAPVEGLRAWVADDDDFIVYDGASWSDIAGGGGGSSETAVKFGVNTTADTTNRLSVKSDAVLFNHDDITPGSGDCQVKINKDAEGDTGSLLFQTGASGRAEFGLAGDDHFHIKVSADGSAWNSALIIGKSTGDSIFGGNVNLDGNSLILDDDGDTYFQEISDDLVGLTIGASANRIRFNASGIGVGLTPDSTATFHDGRGSGGGFWVTDDTVTNGYKFRANVSAVNDYGFYIESTSDGLDIIRARRDGVIIGAPTGLFKGYGTLNVQAVYDDNALLSCYVFDQALDGRIDVEKWDNHVPNRITPDKIDAQTGAIEQPGSESERQHEPMRKFAARIGDAYDPLTLDGYARHWKEKRHLTSMPNEADFDPVNGALAAGEWIQRLVETVEIQAVLIEALNGRVKTLEAGPAIFGRD